MGCRLFDFKVERNECGRLRQPGILHVIMNFNFIIGIFVVFIFFSCKKSSSELANTSIENDTVALSENNFYEFIKQYEYIDYYENGNLKEYNYISPKSNDTLFRFYYDEDGNPKSMDSDKKDLFIASEFLNDGNVIRYMVKPPKFYCRIRVYENIENDDNALINTLSCMAIYSLNDFPNVEIMFNMVDSVYNRPIYDARGFQKNDFDSTKYEHSVFFFE